MSVKAPLLSNSKARVASANTFYCLGTQCKALFSLLEMPDILRLFQIVRPYMAAHDFLAAF